MTKWVYLFTEGNADMRNLLGGKGANLAEMTNLGLPVPEGFTITTEACNKYYEDGRTLNDEIEKQIEEHITKLEEITGKKFKDKENPLLVSVRSGARASMPGMMDTIFNLGLNEEVIEAIAEKSNNPYWAWDCYRKFIENYSTTVMGISKTVFEKIINELLKDKSKVEISTIDLKNIINKYKDEYKKQTGCDFPTDQKEQLIESIKASFESWNNDKAIIYRKDCDIPDLWGTAVNIQVIKYNSINYDYNLGKVYTRDPVTGEKDLFQPNNQNEEIFIGVHNPKHPEAFREICKILENYYQDMQEIEYLEENNNFYILQSSRGKRTAQAALKIACDLVDEGIYTEEKMIDQKKLDILHDCKKLKIKEENHHLDLTLHGKYTINNPKSVITEQELKKVDNQIKKLIKKKKL